MAAEAKVTFRPARQASARVRARHEAGHCVVAIATGWRPRRLSIRAADACDGQIEYHPRAARPPFDPVHRARLLAVLFAGAEVERLVSHRPVFATLAGAGAGDLERVAAILDESYGPAADVPEPFHRLREAEEQRARGRARALLRDHWKAVEAVATALVAAGELSGRAAFAVAIAARPELDGAFERARREQGPRRLPALGRRRRAGHARPVPLRVAER